MVAAFGNLRAYAVFFIAEDEQGGGMQAGGEGVEAAFAERGPVDEESRVPCLVQRPGDVHNLGDREGVPALRLRRGSAPPPERCRCGGV